ncbi:MAG TPA: sugar isomerase domain-containing protein, partial [Candidatus Limnocylindrales bacterium]
MSERIDSAGRRYLDVVGRLVERLITEEWPNIRAAAELVADALARGRFVHVFGTGHSHMLAEELFYRAGGLVRVSPILFEGLMLHASAPLSTSLERLPGLADALLRDHPVDAGDVLIIASNSGGNAVTSEMAQRVRE